MKPFTIISHITTVIIAIFVILLAPSCASTPPARTDAPAAAGSAPDPDTLPPGQDALDGLEAAMTRAREAREQSLAVQAQVFFPDEWNAAETSNEAGKSAGTDTLGQVNGAIAQFTAAAEGWEALTEQSGPLFAQAALAAESAARLAQEQKEKDEAQKAAAAAATALTAATARAEKSRATAMEVDGQTYFANDWKAAESKLQGARGARKTTTDEIKAATALFTGAADAYDGIAGKARAQFTKDKDAASKALQAAAARAQKSRAAVTAAKADAAFPVDWRNAETKNQSAANAKRATIAEMKAAAPLYNTAADAYDEIVRKNTARAAAADAVAKAKARSEKSAAYAVDDDLPNNRYLAENKRLVALAEKSLADGKFDDAVKYARQADEYADQSDNYAALQLKKKEANDAIDTAQARMEQAKQAGIDKRYAETYTAGEAALTDALDFRSGEKWDEARVSALRVITIMEQLPEELPLPAQYRVTAWAQGRDCLWNIAARPEVYGDPAQWPRLYAENRHKMPQPDNPNLLEPGMVLDIPSVNDEYRFGLFTGEE